MKSRHFRWLFPLVVVLVGLVVVGESRAAGNDDAALVLVDSALELNLHKAQSSKKALGRLDTALKTCSKDCSAPVVSKIHVAMGTVRAAQGDRAGAKAAFVTALESDAAASPLPGHSDPKIRAIFAEAKASLEQDATPKSAGASECQRDAAPPRGWQSREAFCSFGDAVKAESNQEWVACAQAAKASVAKEDRVTTRYLGAVCQERAGLWAEALRDYQLVIQSAVRGGMNRTAEDARRRVKDLQDRIPKLVVRAPAGAKELTLELDGEKLPASKIGGEIWVNPGEHRVRATGKAGTQFIDFAKMVRLDEGEKKVVDIVAGERAVEPEDPGVGSTVNAKIGAEVSGYHDNDAVDVLTPAVFARVESPTGGWGLGGSFLVDVVTAASADIVATASPRWTEIRYVPAIDGHKKFGSTDLSLAANLSIEPDYLATSVGAAVAVDLADKMVTPSLGYSFGYEISGRAGTPFDVFSHKIQNHAVDLGSTFVLDKSTILGLTVTGVLQLGDTSKPYRYLPMFAPGTEVLKGETPESVNRKRLPERVAEQLPDNRKRVALAGLLARRFTSVTLRFEERLYVDDWGLFATTTDFLLPVDVSRSVRVWPHLRFHAQTAVQFWELAYAVERTSAGLVVPVFRAGDRELGPMLAGTAGAGTRLAFGEHNDWAMLFNGDVIYSRFLDHLFVQGRLGLFGAVTLEKELE